MKIHEIVEQKIKTAGVQYKFIPLPENLPMDIASHMAFHHDTMEHAMATIIYHTDQGLIAAVKRADTDIDEKKFKQLAGVNVLTFASTAELETLGLMPGIVPYIGLEIPYFVDEKILSVGKAYGTPGSKIIGMVMDAQDLVKVNHGTVGDFTNFIRTVDIHGNKRYRIVSGITPSGDGSLHIGNYLGAVRQFIDIAKTNECFLFVADLHALTTIQDKKVLEHNVETLILNELALLKGFSSTSSENNLIFYRQSDIGLHPELQTIINNITPLGLLKRAHAYKDKLAKDVMEDDINLGLFNYPILMAADILLYKPDLVPVGKDQKQHVEITRDIAEKFNKIYKTKLFKLPDVYIPEEVASVLGTDGKRKMSKSLGNIISIFDAPEVIRKQVMSCFTDPTRAHANDPGHVEGNMVFTYLDYFGKRQEVDEFKEAYVQGKVADVEIKEYLYKCLMDTFAPARKQYEELKNNPKIVKDILENGREKALAVAIQTMKEVREAVGLVNQYSIYIKSQNPNVKTTTQNSNKNLIGNNAISIDDFGKVEIRVGKVEKAENVEKSEKLILLTVNFGVTQDGAGLRTIYTGVRGYGYTPEDFAGKQFLFVVNLMPRKMPGGESQGMILAVDGLELGFGEHGDKKPVFVSAEGLPIGSKVR